MHDCLIAGKSADVVRMFKKELLTRFIGTDEGEVTQYLGCELIRDREAKTAKLVQAGYAERVLKTFGMWYCKPVSELLLLWILITGYQNMIAQKFLTQLYMVDIVVSLDVCHTW